jgi:16S rRNA (guanine(966)-N(2))-methyltransferase RsmD
VRIISGKYKGLQIPMPSKGNIRPTTDRCREALFNVLIHRYHFDQLRVLDLFAGSGAMSIEFASRGAKEVDAVEQNFQVGRQVSNFLKEHKIAEVHMHQADAYKFVERVSHPYQLIFADPPYADAHIAQLLSSILDGKILSDDGLLIVEHAPNIQWPRVPVEQRVYGQSVFSFFSK